MLPQLRRSLTWVFLLQTLPAWTSAQVLTFDFQLDPGDQGQREALVDPATHRAEIQLLISQAPPLCGWNAVIQFDPAQARFAEDSFIPGSFLPGLAPQVNQTQAGMVEIGGENTEKLMAKGEGELGRLQFELLPGASGPVSLLISSFHLHELDSEAEVPVQALATLSLPTPSPPQVPLQLLSLSGEEALAHLNTSRACPGCDLRQIDLAQADLAQVDLRQALLQETILLKADLRQADLREANLKGANLLQADLREAQLQGAELTNTRLGGAKLLGAKLSGALMDTLDLQGVNLTGVTWVDGRICGPGSFNRCK